MRNLDRDRQPVYIAHLEGFDADENEEGELTGEWRPTYTEPERFMPTVSATRGEAVNDFFGSLLDYDRQVTIDDPAFPAKETDALWIDVSTDAPHDYLVKQVARKGSYTVMAAKHVEVDD